MLGIYVIKYSIPVGSSSQAFKFAEAFLVHSGTCILHAHLMALDRDRIVKWASPALSRKPVCTKYGVTNPAMYF